MLRMEDDQFKNMAKRVRRASTSSEGSDMEDFKKSKVRFHISVDREISGLQWFCVWDTDKFANNQYYYWQPYHKVDAKSIEYYLKVKEKKTTRTMNMDEEGGIENEEYIWISDEDDDEEDEEKKEDQEISEVEKDPSNNKADDLKGRIKFFDLTKDDGDSSDGDNRQDKLNNADDVDMMDESKAKPELPNFVMIQSATDDDFRMISTEKLKPGFVKGFRKAIELGNFKRIPDGEQPPPRSNPW